MDYLIWERTDDACTVIATIKDGVFSGTENIKNLLTETGWPETEPDPTRALHGTRIWASVDNGNLTEGGG